MIVFRLLLILKAHLPDRAWDILSRPFWRWYWRQEEKNEKKNCGAISSKQIANSERAVLIEAVARRYPMSNVLELGCGYGQNFVILGPLFPDVQLTGVDWDESRVEAGNGLLTKSGLRNTTLISSDAGSLDALPDKSFDLVISSAFLLRLGPERIDKVVGEMLRLGRRAIILLEQHKPAADERTAKLGELVQEKETGHSYRLWDCVLLFSRFVSPERVKNTKVPSPRWELEQWQEYAHLIEVNLE